MWYDLFKPYLFSLQLVLTKCMCGGPESVPVFHYSKDYILWSFWINKLTLGNFEYAVLQENLGSVALLITAHEKTQ